MSVERAFENRFSRRWPSLDVLIVLSALVRLAKIHFEKPLTFMKHEVKAMQHC